MQPVSNALKVNQIMPSDLQRESVELFDKLVERYGDPPHGSQLKQIWLYFDEEGFVTARALCVYHRKSDTWHIYFADTWGTAVFHRFSDISLRMLQNDAASGRYLRYKMAEDGTWQLKVWAGFTSMPTPASNA